MPDIALDLCNSSKSKGLDFKEFLSKKGWGAGRVAGSRQKQRK